MKPSIFLAGVLATIYSAVGHAAIIGTNIPSLPLTSERVAAAAPAWKSYWENSGRQRQADQSFLAAELRAHGLTSATVPHGVHSAKGVALDESSTWYAGTMARRIADNLISFQTPAGGWSKNTDYTRQPRMAGEMFGSENGSLHLGTNDFDGAKEAWSYVGTFDNDATTTELRFLAKVISAAHTNTEALENSFSRGLDYVLAAQYPNGGWPQVWPLQGGYHDNITLNDNAMLHIVQFLSEVAAGKDEFSFISADRRAAAAAACRRGLDCLLAAQVIVNGVRTVWCQQYDAMTLQPASARNYEMPALTSAESATIVLFLMQLPDANSNEVAAVHGACAWFETSKIEGKAFKSVFGQGRELKDAPGAGPLWARYYEIGTNRPLFGDRDKTIHDNVNDLSRERRQGYGWYRDTPKRVLEHYRKWAKGHPAA